MGHTQPKVVSWQRETQVQQTAELTTTSGHYDTISASPKTPVSRLITQDLVDVLNSCTSDKNLQTLQEVCLVCSYITKSGFRILSPLFERLSYGDQPVPVRVITTSQFGFSDPASIHLLASKPGIDIKIFKTGDPTFHPKGWLFRYRDKSSLAIIGSSNISESAMTLGIEFNVWTDAEDVTSTFQSMFDSFWSGEHQAFSPESVLTYNPESDWDQLHSLFFSIAEPQCSNIHEDCDHTCCNRLKRKWQRLRDQVSDIEQLFIDQGHRLFRKRPPVSRTDDEILEARAKKVPRPSSGRNSAGRLLRARQIHMAVNGGNLKSFVAERSDRGDQRVPYSVETASNDINVSIIEDVDTLPMDLETLYAQTTEAKTADAKMTDAQTTDAQKTDAQTTDAQTTDDQTTDDQTTDDQTIHDPTTDAHTTDLHAVCQITERETTDLQMTEIQTTDLTIAVETTDGGTTRYEVDPPNNETSFMGSTSYVSPSVRQYDDQNSARNNSASSNVDEGNGSEVTRKTRSRHVSRLQPTSQAEEKQLKRLDINWKNVHDHFLHALNDANKDLLEHCIRVSHSCTKSLFSPYICRPQDWEQWKFSTEEQKEWRRTVPWPLRAYDARSPLLRSFWTCRHNPEIIGLLVEEIALSRRQEGLKWWSSQKPLARGFKFDPDYRGGVIKGKKYSSVFRVLAQMRPAIASRIFKHMLPQLRKWRLGTRPLAMHVHSRDAASKALATATKRDPKHPDLSFVNMLKEYQAYLIAVSGEKRMIWGGED